MKLIIHIGTEKTGTSSIQDSLQKNRINLIENGFFFSQCAGNRNNLLFPLYCMDESRGDPYFSHNDIDDLKKRREFKKNFEDNFYSEINTLPKDIHTVIISSEHFHSLLINECEVNSMKELVKNNFESIKVICYLREQIETCVSHYSTVIKSGLSPDFDEFMSRCTPSNPYYNYYDLLERWSNVFGFESMIVSKFSRATLIDGDIASDFYSKSNINYKAMKLINDFQSNQSLNYAGQCLLKELNELQKTLGISLKQPVRFIQDNYIGKGQNVTIDFYNHVYKSFRAENEKISQKYFNQTLELFPKKMPQSTNVDSFDKNSLELIMPFIAFLLKNHINDEFADLCRDVALLHEKDSLRLAYKLMKLASVIRPSGALILKKLKQYEEVLK